MDDEQLNSRLSQIATRWSLLREAHGPEMTHKQQAQAELFDRYRKPAYRYLAAILRNGDAADEVFQEFSVRLIRGDFESATPERGRFRAYLKTTLSRLAVDYHRRRAKSGSPLPEDVSIEADAETDRFDECWRTEVLERTWDALAADQSGTARNHYAVLRWRSENPQADSREMAEALTRQLQPDRPFTDAGIRQTLHRARERFAELLVAEVGASIETDDLDEIETELAALQLTSYCRTAIEARRQRLG
jgi:RNA polymerase sigma-70 factor (ECF subfamily)